MAAGSDGSRSRSKHLILCIDDNSQVLEMLKEFLISRGYSVLNAHDFESAVTLFPNNHIDAVITDYELGEKTAEDVIRLLRALRPDLPVLVFSGREDLPPAVRSLADGCVHKTEIRMLGSELTNLLTEPPRRLRFRADHASDRS